MKKVKIFSLLLALFLVLSLSGCSMIGAGVTYSGTLPLSPSSLDELEIDLISGDLDIYYTDDAPYVDYSITQVGFGFGNPEIRVYEEGNSTRITTDSIKTTIGSLNITVDVYIPRDIVNELEIDMTSGSVDFEDIKLLKLDINMTSGTLNASNVTARELDYYATSGYGNIAGSFDSIEVGSTSGNINVAAEVLPYSVDCELTSGSFTLELPTDASGFELEYDRISGTISSDFDFTGDNGNRSGRLSYGDGACRIDVDITSGSVYIARK